MCPRTFSGAAKATATHLSDVHCTRRRGAGLDSSRKTAVTLTDSHPYATRAREIARTVLAIGAADNDRAGRFSTEAVRALGGEGLLGLLVPAAHGGAGAGPRPFVDVTAALAEADPSAAMVFVMHSLGTTVIAAAPDPAQVEPLLRDIAAGSHLTTLAFSEAGSRSHFWAPVSKAESLNGSGVSITARKSWVTSAGFANSYVVSSLSPNAQGPTDSTLFTWCPLIHQGCRWRAPGTAWDCVPMRRVPCSSTAASCRDISV